MSSGDFFRPSFPLADRMAKPIVKLNTVVTMSKMLAPTALRWPRMANAMGMPGNDVLVQVPAKR